MPQPRLNAGDLDRRIVIETPTAAVSDRGAPSDSFATLATVWAKYRPKYGREALVGGGAEISADADAVFTIRWRSDVGVLERVQFDGRVWDILSAIEFGRQVGLELVCKARRVA